MCLVVLLLSVHVSVLSMNVIIDSLTVRACTRGPEAANTQLLPATAVHVRRQRSHTLHVPVAALGDASGGDVPSTALNQQVAIMNQLMSNTPFTFVNAGVTRISNLSVRLKPLTMSFRCVASPKCFALCARLKTGTHSHRARPRSEEPRLPLGSGPVRMLITDHAGAFRAVVECRGSGDTHERDEGRDAGRQLCGARMPCSSHGSHQRTPRRMTHALQMPACSCVWAQVLSALCDASAGPQHLDHGHAGLHSRVRRQGSELMTDRRHA